MRLWSSANGRSWQQDLKLRPYFSIILAVYNEEDVLGQCLNAMAAIEYESGDFEILVGSDGSSDGTIALLRSYEKQIPQLKVVEFHTRRGKIPVVNDLVVRAKGDVLFFTDADVMLDSQSIARHAPHYADDTIGGVAGNLLLSGEDGVRAEPLGSEQYYMSVENRLRLDEAELHSTVGIFGGHYSIRRELWHRLPDEAICDELYIALNIIQLGKRMVFERMAIAREFFGRTMAEEFRRKSRFAARGLATLAHFPQLLALRIGWPAIMLISHKLLRWFAPFAILLLILSSAVALWTGMQSTWLGPLAIMEACGLGLIMLGFLLNVSKRPLPILSHIYWFAIMNIAFGIGVLRFIFKREKLFWNQSTRVSLPSAVQEPRMQEEVLHS